MTTTQPQSVFFLSQITKNRRKVRLQRPCFFYHNDGQKNLYYKTTKDTVAQHSTAQLNHSNN